MDEEAINSDIEKQEEKTPIMKQIFVDWRVGRFIMFTLITGSVAYGLAGEWKQVLMAAFIGTTLSIFGFYLDYLMDFKKDKEVGKLSNPIARGTLPIAIAIPIVIITAIASIVLGVFVNPWTLIPMACVIIVIVGLGVRLLDRPILRSISLGLLQGLYVMIGAIAAERYEAGVWFIALFLFFAMTGGRALGDTRDLPHDLKTDTMTIPKKYGVRFASIFLLINQLLAYTFSLLVYFMGLFEIAYLYCMIVLIAIGFIITMIFVINPTPKVANITNMLSFGVLGMLFIIGMIVGLK
jgi:geranylgeranylglycerol-phosphate geranylgeranyltransferase